MVRERKKIPIFCLTMPLRALGCKNCNCNVCCAYIVLFFKGFMKHVSWRYKVLSVNKKKKTPRRHYRKCFPRTSVADSYRMISKFGNTLKLYIICAGDNIPVEKKLI